RRVEVPRRERADRVDVAEHRVPREEGLLVGGLLALLLAGLERLLAAAQELVEPRLDRGVPRRPDREEVALLLDRALRLGGGRRAGDRRRRGRAGRGLRVGVEQDQGGGRPSDALHSARCLRRYQVRHSTPGAIVTAMQEPPPPGRASLKELFGWCMF